MEKIANKIAQILVRENMIDGAMLEIYQYGLVRMLEIGGAVFTRFLICLSMGMMKEGLIFFAFFIPLRSYLGGVHLKKYWQCFLASCLVFFMTLMTVKFVVADLEFIGVMTVLGVAGTVFTAFADYRKQKNEIYLLIVCTVLSLLMILAGLFYIKEDNSMMLLLCCTVLLVLGSKVIELLGQSARKNCK